MHMIALFSRRRAMRVCALTSLWQRDLKAHIHARIQPHIQAHIHAHTHTNTHTSTHTQTCIQPYAKWEGRTSLSRPRMGGYS